MGLPVQLDDRGNLLPARERVRSPGDRPPDSGAALPAITSPAAKQATVLAGDPLARPPLLASRAAGPAAPSVIEAERLSFRSRALALPGPQDG